MIDERQPVIDIATLSALDDKDILHGYLRGRNGGDEPGAEFNRAFWHGWKNGMVDGGHWKPDAHQAKLAQVVTESGYLRKGIR